MLGEMKDLKELALIFALIIFAIGVIYAVGWMS
jgi:hypothetical protein